MAQSTKPLTTIKIKWNYHLIRCACAAFETFEKNQNELNAAFKTFKGVLDEQNKKYGVDLADDEREEVNALIQNDADFESQASRLEKNLKTYMNIQTGSTGTREDWFYENEHGKTVNAVDLGEVFEVVKDKNGDWVKAQ